MRGCCDAFCNNGAKHKFPQKPQFGTTALLSTVCRGRGCALPPVKWLCDLFCARLRRTAGSREPAKQDVGVL